MMTKSRRQALMLAGLTVVMVAVYARMLRPSPAGRPAAAPAPETHAAEPVQTASSSVMMLDLPEAPPAARQPQRDRASRLAWGRDPFTGGAVGAEVSGFDLTGILWDATQPIAVVNGQMLRVGDELEGYKVTQIAQDSVSLFDGTQTVTLVISQ